LPPTVHRPPRRCGGPSGCHTDSATMTVEPTVEPDDEHEDAEGTDRGDAADDEDRDIGPDVDIVGQFRLGPALRIDEHGDVIADVYVVVTAFAAVDHRLFQRPAIGALKRIGVRVDRAIARPRIVDDLLLDFMIDDVGLGDVPDLGQCDVLREQGRAGYREADRPADAT